MAHKVQSNMIKAIIFDLNGVFVRSRKLSERFQEDFGVGPEEFLPALADVMARVRQPGAAAMFSYWQPYFAKWKVNFSADEFADYWFHAEKAVPEMIELAEEWKARGLKIFILSNNLAERAEYYAENFPFLKTLPVKVYYSFETGFIKPDERAYRLLLEENGLKPEECLYFDDADKNVAVATGLGLRAFRFAGAEMVKKQIEGIDDSRRKG